MLCAPLLTCQYWVVYYCYMANLRRGERVRCQREAHKLTREQLAQRAGTSTSTIARLELNDQLPRVATLAAIANVLDLSLDELMVAA